MNKATTIDQELKQYIELLKEGKEGQKGCAGENLYNLRNRYRFDAQTSYSDAHKALEKIYDIQVTSDVFLNPVPDSYEYVDGKKYGVVVDAPEFKIGDEAWSPTLGCAVFVDEENIDHANEECWAIISCEEAEEPQPKEFEIEVCRTSYAHRTIKVKALDYTEACDLAIEEAGNYEYSENNAEYSAE